MKRTILTKSGRGSAGGSVWGDVGFTSGRIKQLCSKCANHPTKRFAGEKFDLDVRLIYQRVQKQVFVAIFSTLRGEVFPLNDDKRYSADFAVLFAANEISVHSFTCKRYCNINISRKRIDL